MSIYTSSRSLKNDTSFDVQLLDSRTINKIEEEDILICTGTIRDDIVLRSLVDRRVLPFVVTFTRTPKVSHFLENLTLVINQEIECITPKLIEQIETIKEHLSRFEQHSKSSMDRHRALEKLALLALYQQMQLFSYQNRFKSATHYLKRRDIYLDFKKNSKHPIAYIILHSDSEFRILKIEKGFSKKEDTHQEQQFLINSCDKHFELLMHGKCVLFKNRKFSFEYEDITQKNGEDFLLFGMDDREDFSTYSLYGRHHQKRFEYMSVYDIKKEVKNIDEKALLALRSLKAMMEQPSASMVEQSILYRNLDIFLFSARHFKSVISSIKYDEQSSFKRTVISDIFAKIYENMTEKRDVSQLRFALVLLLSRDFDSLSLQVQSHIFYDIHNGININGQILKTIEIEPMQHQQSEEVLVEALDESHVELFIKKNDENRFIEIFLNTLLSMHSDIAIDRKNTLLFVALVSYIGSTDDIKTTKKEGIEKIQIRHCYLFMVHLQVTYNLNDFFIYMDDFVNLEEKGIEIELFLKDKIAYRHKEHKKDACLIIKIWERLFFKKRASLRKMNHQFSTRLLVVGLFYRLISQQKNQEDILSDSFKHIKEGSIDIKACCQSLISKKFLAIFFRGQGKKECEKHLRSFFKNSQFLLKF